MKIALIFFSLGIACGAIYGLCKFIVSIFKNKLLIQVIFDLIFSLSSGMLFIASVNKYFYGLIRAYICVIFMLGLYLERKTLGKLFAKLYLILYNGARKALSCFKNTRFGKIIFK